MAINSNHTIEDLNDIKCAVVEKNVSKERAEFLKTILEFNAFSVVIAASPPPKAAKATTDKPIEEPSSSTAATEPEPATYTIGVTNLSFNTVNAIFGRLLRTRNGQIVTLAYWNQKEAVSQDGVPYYE